MTKKRYWLYAPGKQAKNWEEFYQKEIFGLSWDRLRDLRSYPTMEAIAAHLRELEKSSSSNPNSAILGSLCR